MADNFVAEIRIFPFFYAPRGWAFCDGQLLSIAQNTALFSLLGTQYGGDGRSNFALPNLQGAAAMHTTEFSGSSPFGLFLIGQTGGESAATLLTSEMPTHTHRAQGEFTHANTNASSPSGAIGGNPAPALVYSNAAAPASVTMNPGMIAVAGASQPHNNMMPYLTMNFCIALTGIFPPRG